MYDAVVPESGLTPAGEIHLEPDWATFVVLPFVPRQARVLAELYLGDRPWAQCPRTFLRRILTRAEGMGLGFKAAFENEFYLLQPDGTPADSTVFCQTYAFDRLAPVLDAITAGLEAQGIVPEMLYPEAGPGQIELPIRYAPALAAADHQVVFRETVRAVAPQHGLIASFVPKPFADQAGCGAHLHLSLWRGDVNVTGERARPSGLSREAEAFVAGVLVHLPALMALTTPSPNSFKRIQPHVWSGAFACWGHGNREAAVRVPPPSRPDRPITNVELKTVDPSCNPYLALGVVIAAGLDGVARDLPLGAPVQQDPANLDPAEREQRGIVALPTSLDVALRRLEEDAVLLEALGPEFARSFLAVRRAEWQALKDRPLDDEVRLLRERY
jgi:glutamine synthetase